MKRRHVSATLLMAMALAGCGMNPAGVAGSSSSTSGYSPDQQQQGMSAIDARYKALNTIAECETTTGSTNSSTGSGSSSTRTLDF